MQGWSPLMCALAKGHAHVAQELLKHNANPNAVTEEVGRVLLCAVCMLCHAVPRCEYAAACCAVLMLCCTVVSHAVSEHAACAGMDTYAGCLQQWGHWCAERDACQRWQN